MFISDVQVFRPSAAEYGEGERERGMKKKYKGKRKWL
jgi:hypothetical protein